MSRAAAGGRRTGLQRRGHGIRGLKAGVQGWLLPLPKMPVGNVLGETGAPRASGPPLIAHSELLGSAPRGVRDIHHLHLRKLCLHPPSED